ncbi:MAG: CopG family transcriptional regulator [Candidatus Wallbacteria bacterium]|nr:CopG family transcriptional regulator [Candidatus Wallbacteria bacterium]
MPKTVTLRLEDDIYKLFLDASRIENRSIANLITTFALHQVEEFFFTDEFETEEILTNHKLLKRLNQGRQDAALRKGSFVE